ncbi:hypothetical protein FLJU110815_11330 [Flavobacterium jumunjinense]
MNTIFKNEQENFAIVYGISVLSYLGLILYTVLFLKIPLGMGYR